MLDPFYNGTVDRKPVIAAVLIVVLGLGGIGIAGTVIKNRSQRAKQHVLEQQAATLYEKAQEFVNSGEFDNADDILNVIITRFASTSAAGQAMLLRSEIHENVSESSDAITVPCQTG